MREDEVESRSPVDAVAAAIFPAAPEHNAVSNWRQTCDIVSSGVRKLPSCLVLEINQWWSSGIEHTVKMLL